MENHKQGKMNIAYTYMPVYEKPLYINIFQDV